MQSYLEISRQALEANARAVTSYVGCPVMGVVKLNGYGVTVPEAVKAWKSAGVSFFGVSTPSEAIELRKCGFIAEEVLLMTPVSDAVILHELLDNNIILTVTGIENAKFYVDNCGERSIRAHIAVDTGMGRFGIAHDDVRAIASLYSMEKLKPEGIFSHFAASFEKDGNITSAQLRRFSSLTDALSEMGISVGIRHIANTCGALRFPEARLDMVRIGSGLVGRTAADVPLKLTRVGKLYGMVTDIRILKCGFSTGYASIYHVKRDTRVAIVQLGYESCFGLSRHDDTFHFRDLLYNIRHCIRQYKSPECVTYKGKSLPLIGRIGTQFSIIDITDADIHPGDFVTADTDIVLSSAPRVFI